MMEKEKIQVKKKLIIIMLDNAPSNKNKDNIVAERIFDEDKKYICTMVRSGNLLFTVDENND